MKLTEDRVAVMVKDTLRANMLGRRDRVGSLVHELISSGDDDDWYLFTVGLCAVVGVTLPKPCCQEHQTLTFGVAHVGPDGEVDPQELFGGLTPDMEAGHPELVAFLRMLIAEAADDADTSLAIFRAALRNGLAMDLMDHALYAATRALAAIAGSN
jgi:hypothetical protein